MLTDDIIFISHIETYGAKSIIYKLYNKWYMDSISGVQLFSEGVSTKKEAIKIINNHNNFIAAELSKWSVLR